MLTMILAMDKEGLIGNSKTKNGLPWDYKEDLEYYKKNTINKINIMGRKTYDSIGRSLPNRETYVLTTNSKLNYKDSHMLYTLNDTLKLIENKKEEIMLIGGVQIFKELFPYVDKILLTKIEEKHVGDVYYKDLNLENFKLTKEEKGINKLLTFQTWERK